MNIVFMSMDTLPSTLWARDLYDQMRIRSDFRKWFPRMCQYGFIEGRDYEYELLKRGHEGVGSDIQENYSGVADGSAVTKARYMALDITDKDAVEKVITEINPDQEERKEQPT